MTLRGALDLMGRKLLEANFVTDLAAEYVQLRGLKKQIEQKMEGIKAQLKQAAMLGGTADAKGSQILIDGNFRIANEKYVKVKLAEDAVDRLKALGIFDRVKKEVIDEGLLEQAFYDKAISEEDFASIVRRDENFRVVVEEIDEVTGKTRREVDFT